MRQMKKNINLIINKMSKKLKNTHAFYFSETKYRNEGKCKYFKGRAVNIVKEIGLGECGYADSYLLDFGRPEDLADKN